MGFNIVNIINISPVGSKKRVLIGQMLIMSIMLNPFYRKMLLAGEMLIMLIMLIMLNPCSGKRCFPLGKC